MVYSINTINTFRNSHLLVINVEYKSLIKIWKYWNLTWKYFESAEKLGLTLFIDKIMLNKSSCRLYSSNYKINFGYGAKWICSMWIVMDISGDCVKKIIIIFINSLNYYKFGVFIVCFFKKYVLSWVYGFRRIFSCLARGFDTLCQFLPFTASLVNSPIAILSAFLSSIAVLEFSYENMSCLCVIRSSLSAGSRC